MSDQTDTSLSNSYRSVFAPELFANRVAIVTGGGSGLGRCVAHELASLGAQVHITGRKLEKLERVAGEIDADGGKVSLAAFDIRDEAAVKENVAHVLDVHGQIDALVNNAGGQYPSPLSLINKKGFEAVVATNLTGGFLMMREVFTQAMSSGGGAIVNVVADMWRGMPGMGHSGAARAGMVNLTQTAAFEWAFAGVRVNGIAPGWIASSGLDNYEGAAAALIPQLSKHVPMRRLGTVAEISAAICFLLSPAAAFITGITLPIDGGAPLGSGVFPSIDHDGTERFEGFHRDETPAALKTKS